MSRLKDYIQTDECKDCIFLNLCQVVNLPHCDGEDYVQEKTVKQEVHHETRTSSNPTRN